MVISASWISRIGEDDGTLNMRGVSTILALANFLKRELASLAAFFCFLFFNDALGYSYWGKDIIFVVSDGYLEGMQAWLSAYHGASQPGTVPL